MPRPLPDHVHAEKSRHGKLCWYFRKGKGRRTRLPGAFGSPEFETALAQASGAAKPKEIERQRRGTLAWLIERYKQSSDFLGLAQATRTHRDQVLRAVCKTAGEVAFGRIDSQTIRQGRERRSPGSALNFLKVMNGLFAFAVEAGYVTVNPVRGVRRPKLQSDGFHTWTVDEIKTYEARWPLGSRERLALDVMLYTGMRRGDACLFGRQHVSGGSVRFKTGKTKAGLDIPLLDALARSIEACETPRLAFLVTEHGQPFASAASFGNWFRRVCIAAGVPGRAHGLRKAGACLAAERGASAAQLMAIFGWKTARMAEVYIRQMDRKHLASEAERLMGRGER